MSDDSQLLDLRRNIDRIDTELIALLARRFELTERIGHLKHSQGLPAEDPERERLQEQAYAALADSHGLDRAALIEIMRSVMQQVKRRHRAIAAGANGR